MREDCKRHLGEPELRLITPTVHLLRAIAVASDPACTYIISSVLPSLVHQATIETKVAWLPGGDSWNITFMMSTYFRCPSREWC